MLNFVKASLVWTAISMAVWENANNVLVFLVPLAALFFMESLRDGGWQVIKDCYGWLIKLIARPVVSHYEAREENYRSIIRKLDDQLFSQKDEGQRVREIRGILSQREEREYSDIVNYSGSLFYRDKYE